ncbi:MAG TPA: cytochrome c-type biogenesis protein [Spongiibacteraceae bacterium]|nr:cytochrome c-type biogenesis protein [Spongiibacteraceae bacterium]
MRGLLAGLSLALCWVLTAHAAIDPYEFDTDAQRERYRHFIEEMRCPKCQNQNLAGSDAPIATDLRRELHRLLLAGRSDREITDYMVARYGEFILYDPPFDKKTAVLWLAPILFLSIGGVVLLAVVRRRRSEPDSAALNTDERARVDKLLRDDSSDEEKPL